MSSITNSNPINRITPAATPEISVVIMPNEKGIPTGKLADAELHWNSGPLAGLRLLGFAVWERRQGIGRNVTFPSRTYSVNGERRSFSLLRPATDDQYASNRARDLILDAMAQYEQAEEQASQARVERTPAPANLLKDATPL